MDLAEYRQQSLETWGVMSEGWERRRDWLAGQTAPVYDWLLDHADPQPGQTVLDIAAGTGDLGLRLADQVGSDGRVIVTDFSPEMLDVARRNGAGRGLDNVEYRVLDAERMDLEDGSVDVAVCRYGYMLMADPAAAVSETRRVLRAGGSLAAAVWTLPERNPWAAISFRTMVERGHIPPPEPGGPGMFALGERGRLRELLTAAGFTEVEVEEIPFHFRYSDFDDLWDALTSLSGGMSRTIQALEPDERDATRAAIEDRVAQFRGDDGIYTLPASSWGALAR